VSVQITSLNLEGVRNSFLLSVAINRPDCTGFQEWRPYD